MDKNKYQVTASLKDNPKLYAAISKIAKREERSIAYICRQALESYADHYFFGSKCAYTHRKEKLS